MSAKGTMNKLLEATMAVLQATPQQQLNIVVLNKTLFYLDLLTLRAFGATATGERWVALPNGPVVRNYKNTVVGALEGFGLAKQLTGGRAKPVRVVKALRKFELISAAEAGVASNLGHSLNPFTSTMISNFSHLNPGWIAARRTSGAAPEINMLVAMQQLNDMEEGGDEWIDKPLDNGLLAACATADTATLAWA